MSFLTLTDLRKTYPDGTAAVKGIHLAIEAGEFVVLLGPSGCGKTTTLRMIAGLELPTGGRIELGGREVTLLPPGARDIGFVFQFYALYPHLSVRENILFPLRSVGTPRAEREARLREVTTRLELAPLLDRRPAQLSGGDQQRISLARAMIRRPQAYLMDEPLGTMDADQRLVMREFIRAQQQDLKVTTIYVTHDQEEAMSLADRVVVMRDGLILQAADPLTVYDQPADLFVAHFVGSPGMNFIPGTLQPETGGSVFVSQSGGLRLATPGGWPTGPCTLGVRPEYVYPDPAGPLAGTVRTAEYLGAGWCLHLDTDAGRLVARVAPGADHAVGTRTQWNFAPAHRRWFGADGRSLT